jgi:hypothetical protein
MCRRTTHVDGRVAHDHLVEASLDKTPSEMLDLLSCLHEKIASGWRKSDGNALSSIPCPDMEAWVSRATVDSEAVEIGMKSCQDGISLAVFSEIRGRWTE